MGWVVAGKFHAWDGLVDITDPCYDRDTWCRINGVKVRRGTYNAVYYLGDNGRITKTAIIHTSLFNSKEIPDIKKYDYEYVGDIGVDAGLAGFFIAPKPDYTNEEWQQICEELNTNGNAVSLNSQGFFTSSGWGDGMYKVWGTSVDGEMVSLFIEFDDETELEIEEEGFEDDSEK
jgi:hypothetical protein